MELRYIPPGLRVVRQGESPLSGSPIRSYTQVAKILGKRYGAPIGAARVRRICLAAETKLAFAFLADPLLRDLLLHGKARLPEPARATTEETFPAWERAATSSRRTFRRTPRVRSQP